MIKKIIILILLLELIPPVIFTTRHISYFSDTVPNLVIIKKSRKINDCYLEYENNIYFYNRTGSELTKLDVQTANFSPVLIDGLDLCLGKDGNSIYYKDKLISNDPESLVIINNGDYIKDKNNVYFSGNLIVGADPLTFSVDSENGYYATDKKAVYCGGKIMEGVDPSNFTYVKVKNDATRRDPFFVVDNNTGAVFFGCKPINVNVDKFQVYDKSTFKWKGWKSIEPSNICGDGENFFDCANMNRIEDGLVEIL